MTSKIQTTRLRAIVVIRLGGRVMKKAWKLLKSEPPPSASHGIPQVLLWAYEGSSTKIRSTCGVLYFIATLHLLAIKDMSSFELRSLRNLSMIKTMTDADLVELFILNLHAKSIALPSGPSGLERVVAVLATCRNLGNAKPLQISQHEWKRAT